MIELRPNIQGVKKENPFVAGLLGIEAKLVSREIVTGLANLDKTRQLLEEEVPMFFVANHLSNADAPVLQHLLTKYGYDDIRKRLVYLRGIRLDGNPVTKFLSGAITSIDVWPPTLAPETAEERQTAIAMTRNSLVSVDTALKSGNIIVVFPEGTRSRDIQLGRGLPQIAHYLKNENTTILPIGINGTERILPTEKGIRSMIPVRADIEIRIGEPFLVRSLAEDKDLKNANGKSFNQQLIDRIMGQKIAPLLEERYRGLYK